MQKISTQQEKQSLSGKLSNFVTSITDEEREYMMKYDQPCLEDAVIILRRMESIRSKIKARNDDF